MRFAFKTNQELTPWGDLLDVWKAADQLDVFESGWLFDHFYPYHAGPGGSCLEGYTCLSALAQTTERLRFGLLVTGVVYRHPALLANIAATLDIISNGRLELGLGAGWMESECRAYGIDLGSVRERCDRFEEAVEIVQSLLTRERTSFEGQYYLLQDAYCQPKPVQQPNPPIMIGGFGPQRTLPLAARFAQHWNMGRGTVEDWLHHRAILMEQCQRIGRDPGEIQMSMQIRLGDDLDVGPVVRQAAAFADAGLDLCIVYLPLPHRAAVVERLAAALRPLTT